MISIDTRNVADPFIPKMRGRGGLPPRSAVAALFTLMPAPSDLLTTYSSDGGETAWHLLAHDSSGVAVVVAKARGEWEWSTHVDPDPATLCAAWHPVSHVESVAIVAFERFVRAFTDGPVEGRETWAVTIAGEKYVLDPRSVAGDTGEAGAFCRGLIEACAK